MTEKMVRLNKIVISMNSGLTMHKVHQVILAIEQSH